MASPRSIMGGQGEDDQISDSISTGYQRPLTAPGFLNEELFLIALSASSSVIVNEALWYLIWEQRDFSCTHKSASLQQESSVFT